ncbi:MAG: sulfate ABC transporter permease subunit CysT [Rhodospirillales bacterium]|nr:sulfate ABC transporter permease subunit CysT [Rhodospirillales bacterium]
MAAAASAQRSFTGSPRKETVVPGFGLTLGLTLLYLALIVLIPLAALILKSSSLGWQGFFDAAFTPRALAAYRLSFGTALIAAAINAVLGLIVAWVLVRYAFPGKRLIDAVVDLPFALPTAVAGIALAALYAENGWIGAPLATLGVKLAFTPAGIVVALLFEGLPFVVRTVEPVLQDLDPEIEEAAASLGAGRIQTFLRIILPAMMPAILTGFALAFARGLGEYGSVIFIAGNVPMVSEIAPLLVIIKLEQFDYAGATAIATVVLVAGFNTLFAINWLQRWTKRRSA